MNIGLLAVNEVFDKEDTGTSRYAGQISKSLLANKDLEVTKITANSLPGFVIQTMIYDFSKFDIIHSMDYKIAYPRKGKAIHITTAQDFSPRLHPDMWVSSNFTLKHKIWLQTALWGIKCQLKTDHMITVSEQTKREAMALGYDKNKITVVNMGIDPRFINTPSLENNKKEFRIGYLGGLHFHKRVSFILQVANLRKEKKNEEYKIYGLGQEAKNLQAYKEANKLKNVNLMGFAPENELIKTYDELDVHIIPTRIEGFSLPIIESQARGIPVIILKDAMITEEVRKYCLIAKDVEDASDIIEDLKQNGYDSKKRKQAMEYAKSFTWERAAKETIDVYKKVLAER